jgi:hypothetical protein
MITIDLQQIADSVVRRAERQGFVIPREIREEVTQAGLPENLWKEVLEKARPALNYRHGRYYHLHAVSERIQQEQDMQQVIHSAIRQVIQQQRSTQNKVERRDHDRTDFIQPVEIETEDNHTFHLLSRDLSTSGIRLIGTRSFLGQKVRLTIPRSGDKGPWSFVVRILWTCAVGDDMFENGGTFLELVPAKTENEE